MQFDFFPSRQVSWYMVRLFLTRTLAVLAMLVVVLQMLDITGLSFIANMKAPFITGERNTDPGDFTVDALAKDAKLMEMTSTKPLPALTAAIGRFEEMQAMGHGDQDFSSIFVFRNKG